MATSSDELLQAIKSYATGMLKGNTADTLGAPVDIINEAIVRPIATALGKADKVSKEPVGGSKSIRKLFGMATDDANIAETVGSMISAGGVAKAIVLPAFVTKSIKQVKKAEKALNEGTDAAQVEKYTGIYKLPDNIDDGILRTVLDDSKARLITGPGGLERMGVAPFEVNIGPSQFLRFQTGDIKKLPDVLDHPELYRAVPELRETLIGAAPGANIGSAFYNSADNYIGLGYQRSEKDAMVALLHETQHAVQNKYGMNAGANPWQFMERPNDFAAAHKALFAEGKAIDRLRVDEAYKDAVSQYNKVAGEAEANAVERMYVAGDKRTAPALTYYGDEYALNRMISSPVEGRKVDQDPVIRAIIDSALKSSSSK